MHLVKGTKAAADLAERATRIIGLQDRQADLKNQVKKLTEQIGEEFDDAESTGFDKKALRQCVKEMRLDDDQRQAQFDFEEVLDTYRHALDIIPGGDAVTAEKIFSAMTPDERTEASVRVTLGEDAVTAVTKAVSKRGRTAKAPEAVS